MIFWCDQPHKHWYEQLYYPYKLNTPHNSKHVMDIYFLTHIFWPLLMTYLLYPFFSNKQNLFWILFGFTTLFELFENLPDQIKRYRKVEIDSRGETSYRGDSFINMVADIFGNVLGILLGIYAREYTGLIMFILFIVISSVTGMDYWKEFIGFMNPKDVLGFVKI